MLQTVDFFLYLRHLTQCTVTLRTELQLTMGTFSVSVCGLFAAFFGMNLLSHIEDHPHAFLLVSSSVLMATVSVWRLLLAHGRRKNLW